MMSDHRGLPAAAAQWTIGSAGSFASIVSLFPLSFCGITMSFTSVALLFIKPEFQKICYSSCSGGGAGVSVFMYSRKVTKES